jgi:1-deoxy-D-xylulose-5-phosphate synthase
MDQLVHDVCMQNLPVIFAVDRAGLVGEDGETHQGLFDIAWSRPVPNLCVTAPRDEGTLRELFETGLQSDSPMMIRFPRGRVPESVKTSGPLSGGTPGNCLSPEVVAAGEDWVLFGYGRTVDLMLRAREHARESAFLPLPTVVDLKCLKPLPVGELREMLTTHSFAIVAEDGYAEGGAGEAIAAFAESIRGEAPADVAVLGIPDIFVPQGKVCEQDEYCGLTPGNVVKIYAEHQKRAHRQAAPLEGAR